MPLRRPSNTCHPVLIAAFVILSTSTGCHKRRDVTKPISFTIHGTVTAHRAGSDVSVPVKGEQVFLRDYPSPGQNLPVGQTDAHGNYAGEVYVTGQVFTVGFSDARVKQGWVGFKVLAFPSDQPVENQTADLDAGILAP